MNEKSSRLEQIEIHPYASLSPHDTYVCKSSQNNLLKFETLSD